MKLELWEPIPCFSVASVNTAGINSTGLMVPRVEVNRLGAFIGNAHCTRGVLNTLKLVLGVTRETDTPLPAITDHALTASGALYPVGG